VGWLARFWAGLVRSPALGPEPGAPEEEEEEPPLDPDAVAIVAIEDAIDLHHFAPRDVPSVVDEYLRAARAEGRLEVTLIHGRGKGVQRQRVQAILQRHPAVASFAAATGARALGATVVQLRPRKRR
jgi:dsDNA-specific endonuclease/ATPase MutS2